MDNRTLDARVAREFFKQPKPIVTHSQHLNPIQSGVWICEPAYHGGDVCQWEPLHFTTNPSACSLVLDEIERRGWKWVWRRSWDCYKFAIVRHRLGLISAKSSNRYEAVCLAALQAAEGEKK